MKAAIYARKSTDQSTRSEDAKSVALQVQNAKAAAAAQGWTVDDADVYVDDGISGADSRKLVSRQRLLADVRSGRAQFRVLMMRDRDRWSRADGDESFGELKALAEAGVLVWFYASRQAFAYGSLQTTMIGVLEGEVAAEERRKASTRTHEALVRKWEAGHVVGGRIFGYRNVDVMNGADPDGRPIRSHVERRVHEPEAAVVREIYGRYAAGQGYKQIAHALNGKRAPAPRPKRRNRVPAWEQSTVREALIRPLYRGVERWNVTKKRNARGQHVGQRQRVRPEQDWRELDASPQLPLPGTEAHRRRINMSGWSCCRTCTASSRMQGKHRHSRPR